MRAARITLIAFGVAGMLWGVWLLLSTQRIDQLFNLALWLGGVWVLHDFVLVPLITVVRQKRAGRRSEDRS